MRRSYTKDKLIDVACSLGWLVRDTMGIDTFRACLNLVDSSPGCGGGLERLAKAYKLDRLGFTGRGPSTLQRYPPRSMWPKWPSSA